MKKYFYILSILCLTCISCASTPKISEDDMDYDGTAIRMDFAQCQETSCGAIVDNSNDQDIRLRTCNINSSCIRQGELITENGIEFVVATQEGIPIYKKTVDPAFHTKSGLSITDSVLKYLDVYSGEIYIEPGTCVFIQLEDDWRACIAYSDFKVKLDAPILYFYRVDSRYTHAWTLREWNTYIENITFSEI